MRFESQPQEECYKKILPWMKELFGEFAAVPSEEPMFATVHGTALAFTTVLPWGADDAVILTRAYVTIGTELTPDLMRFLLRENANMRFGAFGIDGEGAIFFEHSIVGSTADKKELASSVLAVVSTADQYDDQIVARWGGQRGLDLARDRLFG